MFTEREIKIINYLMGKDDYVNGEVISTFLGISSKTFRSDIKKINQQFVDLNLKAKILGVRGKGYFIEIENSESFNKKIQKIQGSNNELQFIPTTVEGRVHYIINELLILEFREDRGITQEQLCDQLFISLATLKRDLITVKRKLREFNIKLIKYSSKGIALEGSEEDLRACIKYFIFEKPENIIIDLNSITPLFNREQIIIVKETLSRIITKNKIPITDIGFYNLLIHILIVIERIKNSNKVDTIKFTEIVKNSFEYDVAIEIAEEVSKIMGVKFPKEEIYFITQHLCAQKIIDSEIERENFYYSDGHYSLTMEILSYLKETIDIDFTKDELLISSLAIHLKSAINRIKFDMHIKNDLLYEIKRNYSFAYNIALMASSFIENKIEKSINEDEIGFICLHFAAALQRLKNKNKEKLRVLIICASGMGTSMILSSKIKSEFKDAIKIVKIIPLNKLDAIPKDEYDAIISTISINDTDNKLKDKSIAYISPVMRQRDIDAIYKLIDTNKEAYIIRFLEFTEEDLFFLNTEFQTKEEIMNFMLEQMVMKNYIKKEDKSYFFKREEISSTEIGNLIAIPHSIDIDPKISKVCILINKDPVIWNEEQVKIVILMSIEKDLYLEFGEMLEELYEKLENKEQVMKLFNVKNYAEFVKTLR